MNDLIPYIKTIDECDTGGAFVGDGAMGPVYNTATNTPGIGNAVPGGADRWDNSFSIATQKPLKKSYFKIRKKKKKK